MNLTLSKTFDIRHKRSLLVFEAGHENDLGVLTLVEGMRLKRVRCDINVCGPSGRPIRNYEEPRAPVIAQACRIEVALTQGKYTRCLINENADNMTGRARDLASDVAPILLKGNSIRVWLNVYDRNLARSMLQAVKQDGLFSLHCSMTFSGPVYKERRMKP